MTNSADPDQLAVSKSRAYPGSAGPGQKQFFFFFVTREFNVICLREIDCEAHLNFLYKDRLHELSCQAPFSGEK